MSQQTLLRMLPALAASASAAVADETLYQLHLAAGGEVVGRSGETVDVDIVCHLYHLGDGPGVDAWSFGVTADAGAISAITTADTDAGRLLAGGFERSELTAGEGNVGGVSTVVLPVGITVTAPPQSHASVARITARFCIPTEPPVAPPQGPHLRLVGGLRDSVGAVPLAVRAGGVEVEPLSGGLTVVLRPSDPCALAEVNVGFSTQRISSGVPLEGILGAHEGFRSEIDVFTDRGRHPRQRVFVNLISQLPGPDGIQAWSYGIRAGGEIRVLEATTAGTIVEEQLDGGFALVDTNPAECCVTPIPGVVSAVVLSFTETRSLPSTGTESVLKLELEAQSEQAERDIFGSLVFESGLQAAGGNGQPVPSAVTIAGATHAICNSWFCALTFHLLPRQFAAFIRGNANADFRLDIADAVWILSELFLGGPASPCVDALDANDDGELNLADALFVVRYQFLGGSPPPPPFAACGEDPQGNVDGLGCEETQLGCP